MKKELAELLQKFMISGQMLCKHREEEEIFLGLIGQGEDRAKSHQSRKLVVTTNKVVEIIDNKKSLEKGQSI